MAPEESAGDLAIVLHSHMPYVEGFGTYPFGEEWLFDAVIRSYLPVLEVAERLTMTITPVLADQLEDAGVKERLRRFLTDWRIAAAAADIDEVDAECRDACLAEHERYSHALELLDADGGTRCAPSSGRPRRDASRSPARRRRTPCCRCSRPARACACSWRPASARTGAASAGTAASGCPSAPTRRGSSGAWRRRA